MAEKHNHKFYTAEKRALANFGNVPGAVVAAIEISGQ
jgi:hypothetical protein